MSTWRVERIDQTGAIKRGILTARKAASLSGADYHKVGAAILKGKRIISIGWNSHRTHPQSKTRYHAHHAEFAAIVGNHKMDIADGDIYVTRITPGGRLSMAKPCDDCDDMIRAAGIRRVFFTDHDGNVRKMY